MSAITWPRLLDQKESLVSGGRHGSVEAKIWAAMRVNGRTPLFAYPKDLENQTSYTTEVPVNHVYSATRFGFCNRIAACSYLIELGGWTVLNVSRFIFWDKRRRFR
jgi:hypothetical protein